MTLTWGQWLILAGGVVFVVLLMSGKLDRFIGGLGRR